MSKWLQSLILIIISIAWGFAIFTLISLKDPYCEFLGGGPFALCILNAIATLGLSESMKVEMTGVKGILKNTLLSLCTCVFLVFIAGLFEAKYS